VWRRFKDTRHFELDLKGSGLNYEVGDSMTVWPTNDPALVDEIVNRIGAKGGEPVKGKLRGSAGDFVLYELDSPRLRSRRDW
jgi:sulfite reductase alpha subunit-like flavoprotein